MTLKSVYIAIHHIGITVGYGIWPETMARESVLKERTNFEHFRSYNLLSSMSLQVAKSFWVSFDQPFRVYSALQGIFGLYLGTLLTRAATGEGLITR